MAPKSLPKRKTSQGGDKSAKVPKLTGRADPDKLALEHPHVARVTDWLLV